MIKLQRPPKPTELTAEKIEELTQTYLQTGKSVWSQTYIKIALLSMSHGKCCFCECRVDEESKYMEVEHFHPKSLYPNEVVLWENLLPSCKLCNGSKGDHDTVNQRIINPATDDPKEHLVLRNYRLYPKTPLGDTTINEIDLNNRTRLVTVRFEIGEEIINQLETLLERVETYQTTPTTRRKNSILNSIEKLLVEAIPTAKYSATAAHVLLNEPNYQTIKSILQSLNLWSDYFVELEKQAIFCKL